MIYKNCPNCGARINNDLRFCPNCNFDFAANQRQNIRATQPSRAANRAQSQHDHRQNEPAKATRINHNYWQFLISGLTHPLTPKQTFDSRFGLISLTASALLVALATLASNFSRGGLIIGLHSFVLLLLSNFTIVTMAFIARRFCLGDRQRSYLETTTTFAHYTNLNLFIGVFLLFWGILDLNLAVYYLIFIIGGLWLQMAFLILIARSRPKTKLDPSYAYLIALVLSAIIIGLIIAILGVSTLSDLFRSTTLLDNF